MPFFGVTREIKLRPQRRIHWKGGRRRSSSSRFTSCQGRNQLLLLFCFPRLNNPLTKLESGISNRQRWFDFKHKPKTYSLFDILRILFLECVCNIWNTAISCENLWYYFYWCCCWFYGKKKKIFKWKSICQMSLKKKFCKIVLSGFHFCFKFWNFKD